MALDNIYPLDPGSRMRRDNTTRSSHYKRRQAALSTGQRLRLDHLENELFDRRCSRRQCEEGALPLPECCFLGSEGKIWWFYSRKTEQFVLIDFELTTGGSGGGLPVPEAEEALAGGRGRPMLSWDVDRIAACHVNAASAFSRALPLTPAAGLAARYAEALADQEQDPTRRRRRLRRIIHLGIQFFESSAVDRVWLTEGEGQSVGLPAWSILSAYVSRPQQLLNPYARLILRGEALTRMAMTSCRWERGIDGKPADLLDDSRGLIDLICAREEPVLTQFEHLVVTRAVGANLYTDDALLYVARTELAGQLAHHLIVAAEAERMLAEGRKKKKAWAVRQMRKFALFADFAVLSERLFPRERPSLNVERLWRDYEADLSSVMSVDALRSLETLDTTIQIIVMSLDPSGEQATHPDEAGALRDRLLGITKSLLEAS